MEIFGSGIFVAEKLEIKFVGSLVTYGHAETRERAVGHKLMVNFVM
jgi:hypothetical protein